MLKDAKRGDGVFKGSGFWGFKGFEGIKAKPKPDPRNRGGRIGGRGETRNLDPQPRV